jgi:hypothetical protein
VIGLDQNLAGLEQGAGVHLEQAGGVEDDGRGGWLLGGGNGRKMQGCAEGQQKCPAQKTRAHREIRHG